MWRCEFPATVWIPLAVYQGSWCLLESLAVFRFRAIDPGALAETRAVSGTQWLPLCAGIVALSIVVASTFEKLADGSSSRAIVTLVFAFPIGAIGIGLRIYSIAKLGPRFLDQIALLKKSFHRKTRTFSLVQPPRGNWILPGHLRICFVVSIFGRIGHLSIRAASTFNPSHRDRKSNAARIRGMRL